MNEWKNIKIGDVGKIVTGSTPPTSDKENYGNDYSWVSPADLGKTKYIENTLTKLSKKGFDKTRKIPAKSILVTCIGSTIGKMGMTKIEMSTNQQINSIIVNKEVYDENFIYYCINYNFPKFLNKIASQAVPIISKSEFEKLEIKAPSLVEQIKIGTILNLLDKKIELQSKKIEALKLYKLCIKEMLFARAVTSETKLSNVLKKWNGKNKNNQYSYVESVSNKHGFIAQNEQFDDRSVASNDKTNYYIIRKNVFAYNPSRLDVGSLALKENDVVSLVSPLYECFTTNQDVHFMYEWFNSKEFRKGTYSKFEGGVRNTLNFSNLCDIKISLPSITVQNKISQALCVFNNKIKLEEDKYKCLLELKKGLMQSMFV